MWGGQKKALSPLQAAPLPRDLRFGDDPDTLFRKLARKPAGQDEDRIWDTPCGTCLRRVFTFGACAPCPGPSAAGRRRSRASLTYHLIACGLIGEPVPPVITSGGPQKKNS
jgi:hypothetical protein